jgi:hypothetical protein
MHRGVFGSIWVICAQMLHQYIVIFINAAAIFDIGIFHDRFHLLGAHAV